MKAFFETILEYLLKFFSKTETPTPTAKQPVPAVTTLLKFGSKGDAVRAVQRALNIKGYVLTVDGEYGHKTELIIMAFQKRQGLKVDGIVGPETLKALNVKPVESEPQTKPKPAPEPIGPTPDIPTWMAMAKAEVGQKEISGNKDNPRILWYHDFTSFDGDHDEVAWCASFVNACLITCGYKGSAGGTKGTSSAAAKSFDTYGTKCGEIFGAVMTLRHPDGGRHVTFFVRREGEYLIGLGGNQSNQVKESKYRDTELVSLRWPVLA